MFYHNSHICAGKESENFQHGSSHLFCVNLTGHKACKNTRFCLKHHYLSECKLTKMSCLHLNKLQLLKLFNWVLEIFNWSIFLIMNPCYMHISSVLWIKSLITNSTGVHKSIWEMNWFYMISSILPLLYSFQAKGAGIVV